MNSDDEIMALVGMDGIELHALELDESWGVTTYKSLTSITYDDGDKVFTVDHRCDTPKGLIRTAKNTRSYKWASDFYDTLKLLSDE